MSDTTYEEATRCPKCNQPGQFMRQQHVPRHAGGGMAHFINCDTKTCEWFGTSFIVQVREDGTIPNRETDRPGIKTYPKLTPDQEAYARRQIEEARRQP